MEPTTGGMDIHQAAEHASRHVIATSRYGIWCSATTLLDLGSDTPFLLQRWALTRARAIEAVFQALVDSYLDGMRFG